MCSGPPYSEDQALREDSTADGAFEEKMGRNQKGKEGGRK